MPAPLAQGFSGTGIALWMCRSISLRSSAAGAAFR
jgi:hypothetical protein